MFVFCFFLYVCMCLEPRKARRGHQMPPGTGVVGGCELPSRCWELNPGPLQKQQVSKLLCHLFHPQELVLLFLTMFIYVCLYVHTCECSCTHRPEEGVRFFFFFLGLKLWAGVSLLIWIARIQAQALCKAILSLNHRAVFLAQ